MTGKFPCDAVLDVEAYRLWYEQSFPGFTFFDTNEHVRVLGIQLDRYIVDTGRTSPHTIPMQFVKLGES